jgi:hypothetical protein
VLVRCRAAAVTLRGSRGVDRGKRSKNGESNGRVRRGTRATRAGGGEGEDTGAIVNEMRHQRKRQYTRQEIDLPPGRGGPTRQSCNKELVATMLFKKTVGQKMAMGVRLRCFLCFFNARQMISASAVF